MTHPSLPCFPCPHDSACCAFGVTLKDEEAHQIVARFSERSIYRTRWGEWRTRVKAGRCVFLSDNACTLHGEPFFPAVCRGFPWIDAETGGPYEFDRTICPEFVWQEELHQLQRATGHTRSGRRDPVPRNPTKVRVDAASVTADSSIPAQPAVNDPC